MSNAAQWDKTLLQVAHQVLEPRTITQAFARAKGTFSEHETVIEVAHSRYL